MSPSTLKDELSKWRRITRRLYKGYKMAVKRFCDKCGKEITSKFIPKLMLNKGYRSNKTCEFDICDDCYSSIKSEMGASVDDGISAKITMYDKIMSMSKSELAEFLAYKFDDYFAKYRYNNNNPFIENDMDMLIEVNDFLCIEFKEDDEDRFS